MRELLVVAAAGLALTGELAAATDPAPGDFAFNATIDTPGNDGVYQLTLPLHVYQNTRSPALDDLRVFNAAGTVVPYALLRVAASTDTVSVAAVPVPFYPLRGDGKLGVSAVHFSIRSDGTSVDIQSARKGPRTDQLLGYLVDLRSLKTPISALTLHWDPRAVDFSLLLHIDVSDDMVNWRSAGTAGLANLHYQGQTFLQQRVDGGRTMARFWRLSWAADQATLALTGIEATAIATAAVVPRSTLVTSATAVAGAAGEFRFRNDSHLPLDRINLKLPEANSVAAADFFSRTRATDPWRLVGHLNLYRLRPPKDDSEVTNAAAIIAADDDPEWRLTLTPAAAASGGTIDVDAAWVPHTLQFITRGGGPYRLAYGSATAASAAVPATTLLAGLRTADGTVPTLPTAILSAPSTAGGLARLQPPPPPLPWKTWILWAVLICGALLIATLAFRMLREPGANPRPSHVQ